MCFFRKWTLLNAKIVVRLLASDGANGGQITGSWAYIYIYIYICTSLSICLSLSLFVSLSVSLCLSLSLFVSVSLDALPLDLCVWSVEATAQIRNTLYWSRLPWQCHWISANLHYIPANLSLTLGLGTGSVQWSRAHRNLVPRVMQVYVA